MSEMERAKIRSLLSAAWPGPECGSAYNGIVVDVLAQAIHETVAAALKEAERERDEAQAFGESRQRSFQAEWTARLAAEAQLTRVREALVACVRCFKYPEMRRQERLVIEQAEAALAEPAAGAPNG